MRLELELQDIVMIAEQITERIHVPPKVRWMTRAEAADHLRISTKTLDTLVRVGELPCYRPTEGKPLFSQQEIDLYVTDRRDN